MGKRQVCLLGLEEKGERSVPGRGELEIFHWELKNVFLHISFYAGIQRITQFRVDDLYKPARRKSHCAKCSLLL